MPFEQPEAPRRDWFTPEELAPPQITDNIWYGLCGYWTDDWAKLASSQPDGHGIPLCPVCGAPGFIVPTAEWWANVDAYEAGGAPGYRRTVELGKNTCPREKPRRIEGVIRREGYEVEFDLGGRPDEGQGLRITSEPADLWDDGSLTIYGIVSPTVRLPFAFDVRERPYRFWAEIIDG